MHKQSYSNQSLDPSLRSTAKIHVPVNDSRPWWLWPNLLSLDAPVIAVLWQRFLAESLGIPVPVRATIALGLIVWAIYIIDRQLDTRDKKQFCADRHQFANQYPFTFTVLASVVLSSGVLAALGLPDEYLISGVVIAGTLAIYMTFVHFTTLQTKRPGLKHTTVGLVFSAGVGIPLIAAFGFSILPWLPCLVAFAGLCAINCVFISSWEDAPESVPPRWLPLGLGFVASGAAILAATPVAIAVLSSIFLLCMLNLARGKIAVRTLRVLADTVLLTPLIVPPLSS